MKTISEAAEDTGCNMGWFMTEPREQIVMGFRSGIAFAQRWIPIEEELPEQITHPVDQSNGNTLYFYENYIVKGYWHNEAKRKEILMATYMPCSVCWYFNIHKSKNTVDFTITHWRPIELK